MLRICENFFSTALLNDMCIIDNRNAVADLIYYTHFMSDDHDSHAKLFVDIFKKLKQ